MARAEDLDWDDLRFFLAAVRMKTLAGAARTLHVEHTTVGRRLTGLERALGAPLVLRGAEGLQLTRLGAQVVAHAEEMERAVDGIRELLASEGMRVRLAVPSGFTHFFTADLAGLRRQHPGLVLEILSGSGKVDLSKGEADVALRSGPVEDPDLVVRKLCDAGFSVYASEGYLARKGSPKDLDDLSGHELVAYHEQLAAVPAARWVEARASAASIVLRSRELSEMMAAAVDGVGMAVLPCSLADGEPALRRLTDAVVARRPMTLVHRREARLSRAVRVVAAFVVEVVKRHAERIEGARTER